MGLHKKRLMQKHQPKQYSSTSLNTDFLRFLSLPTVPSRPVDNYYIKQFDSLYFYCYLCSR